jgi:nucleolar protein 14
MRELRRDGAFLAATRDRERAVVDAERMASQRAFYSELQAFEGDMRSGGQAGMNPHLKKAKK